MSVVPPPLTISLSITATVASAARELSIPVFPSLQRNMTKCFCTIRLRDVGFHFAESISYLASRRLTFSAEIEIACPEWNEHAEPVNVRWELFSVSREHRYPFRNQTNLLDSLSSGYATNPLRNTIWFEPNALELGYFCLCAKASVAKYTFIAMGYFQIVPVPLHLSVFTRVLQVGVGQSSPIVIPFSTHGRVPTGQILRGFGEETRRPCAAESIVVTCRHSKRPKLCTNRSWNFGVQTPSLGWHLPQDEQDPSLGTFYLSVTLTRNDAQSATLPTSEVVVQVLPEMVLSVSITCLLNCPPKVLRDDRMVLRAICHDPNLCTVAKVALKWDVLDEYGIPHHLKQNLGETLEIENLQSSKTYLILLRAVPRLPFPARMSPGSAMMVVRVPLRPPVSSLKNCLVEPRQGVERQIPFHVTCSLGDELRGGEVQEFDLYQWTLKGEGGQRQASLLRHQIQPEFHEVYFLPGEPEDDFEVRLLIQATDKEGKIHEAHIRGIQVFSLTSDLNASYDAVNVAHDRMYQQFNEELDQFQIMKLILEGRSEEAVNRLASLLSMLRGHMGLLDQVSQSIIPGAHDTFVPGCPLGAPEGCRQRELLQRHERRKWREELARLINLIPTEAIAIGREVANVLEMLSASTPVEERSWTWLQESMSTISNLKHCVAANTLQPGAVPAKQSSSRELHEHVLASSVRLLAAVQAEPGFEKMAARGVDSGGYLGSAVVPFKADREYYDEVEEESLVVHVPLGSAIEVGQKNQFLLASKKMADSLEKLSESILSYKGSGHKATDPVKCSEVQMKAQAEPGFEKMAARGVDSGGYLGSAVVPFKADREYYDEVEEDSLVVHVPLGSAIEMGRKDQFLLASKKMADSLEKLSESILSYKGSGHKATDPVKCSEVQMKAQALRLEELDSASYQMEKSSLTLPWSVLEDHLSMEQENLDNRRKTEEEDVDVTVVEFATTPFWAAKSVVTTPVAYVSVVLPQQSLEQMEPKMRSPVIIQLSRASSLLEKQQKGKSSVSHVTLSVPLSRDLSKVPPTAVVFVDAASDIAVSISLSKSSKSMLSGLSALVICPVLELRPKTSEMCLRGGTRVEFDVLELVKTSSSDVSQRTDVLIALEKRNHRWLDELWLSVEDMGRQRPRENGERLSRYFIGFVVDPQDLQGLHDIPMGADSVHVDVSISTEKCMWWNDTKQDWEGSGCELVNVSHSTMTCACRHLSFFGAHVLVQPVFVDPWTDFHLLADLDKNIMMLIALLVLMSVASMIFPCAFYLDHKDLEKEVRAKSNWLFLIDEWISITLSPTNSLVHIAFPISNEKQRALKYTVPYFTLHKLRSGHQWISIFTRRNDGGPVSRCEKLAQVVIGTVLSMLTSLMFFGVPAPDDPGFQFEVGSLTIFSLRSFVKSAEVLAIVLPITLFQGYLFNRSTSAEKVRTGAETLSRHNQTTYLIIESGHVQIWCPDIRHDQMVSRDTM
ncbi:unnamed protein product [Cyprideis torosa]|uniref:PKD/REJ-like domain-containing protein n=1 Tax=Cyprideis torosa TaxID=163714 RepID=A0A7R8ZSA9_9CRUS|nr:unnamed protein product [Cyprideis torosa]CAG0895113.1 unnamed protein product [Cyprideis torosa]